MIHSLDITNTVFKEEVLWGGGSEFRTGVKFIVDNYWPHKLG